MKHAFSLVELSIVLVILGLLTGGILTGQSLIRASELRSVTTEYQRYITATQTFRDKYFALPGDMNNATRFWGDDNAACADAAIPNGTPGTCNGNGNGGLEWAGASATGERFQFWKHLSLAGVIEGTYSGLAGSNASGRESIAGTNVPSSKISTAAWSIISDLTVHSGSTVTYGGFSYGNAFGFGGGVAGDWPNAAILRPEEAWNIDTKMDDGRPGTGRIIARYWNNACGAGGASETDTANSTYNLSSTTLQCMIYFVRAF